MRIKGRKYRRLEFDVTDYFKKDQQWCDKDHLLFVTMMQLNEKFVEDEINANIVDWSSDEYHQHAHDEFVAVYKFWKNYKRYEKSLEDRYLHPDWSPVGIWFMYEDKLKQLEDQMMQRLINVRGFMWT